VYTFIHLPTSFSCHFLPFPHPCPSPQAEPVPPACSPILLGKTYQKKTWPFCLFELKVTT
jgi:hypothetical protein